MADARRGKGPFFALIPHGMIDDPELKLHDLALYVVLKRFCDFAPPDVRSVGGATPSSRRLARETGMSRNTVLTARDRLRKRGWVSWVRRGDRDTLLYFVHNERLTEDERRFWTEEALELKLAWEEGGVDRLLEAVEEGLDDVDN